VKRKIIQIAFEVRGEVETSQYSDDVNGSTYSNLYALADDGTIWIMIRNQWVLNDNGILPEIEIPGMEA
jgi:hypothetical protein